MTDVGSILVIDDDRIFADRLARAFADRGWTANAAYGVRDGFRTAMEVEPDVAVIDLKMGDGSGLELLKQLRAQMPEIEVVVLTGYGSVATAVDATKLGAVNFITKPAHADMVLDALERGRGEPLVPHEPDYAPPSLARAEWEHIQRVLEDCDGNISQAARLLGLHRRTLQRKLNKYPPNQ
ncbi:MAG: response regulator [Proteobacteria bacterium]|nr:response regulator [Pseudomonadota bacterium]